MSLVWRVYPPRGSHVETGRDPLDNSRLMVECWAEEKPFEGQNLPPEVFATSRVGDYMRNVKYQLQSAPSPRDDGTAAVDHVIIAIYQDGDDWLPVPNRQKTISVDGFKLGNVMGMPDNSPEYKSAKINAYKRLLYEHRDWEPDPQTAWDIDTLQSVLDANDSARNFAEQADEFLTVTLAQSYPIGFSL